MISTNEWRLCQSSKSAIHEEPKKTYKQPHFKETKMVVIKHGARNDEQVNVHEVSDEDENPNRNDKAGVALGVAGNQGVEWNREVDKEHQHEGHLVISQHTAHVVRDFLRDVGVPNQQELA